jgi:pentatricopeptide repeat protein
MCDFAIIASFMGLSGLCNFFDEWTTSDVLREGVVVLALFAIFGMLRDRVILASKIRGGLSDSKRLRKRTSDEVSFARNARECSDTAEQTKFEKHVFSTKSWTTSSDSCDNSLTDKILLAKKNEGLILRSLTQRQFTAALNMFRCSERANLDSHFTEELFAAFIQSAIRVDKLDVVDRMLRKIKQLGMEPSLNFWQSVFRLLASRKQFEACLSIHSLFGSKLPMDRVLLSCLVNAALETSQSQQAAKMLERHHDVKNLETNDYILFFRTFVTTGDLKSAEKLYQRLLENDAVTPHMLNLLLLTCVNAGMADHAMCLIREAHEHEKTSGNAYVDVVSYNTLIKGLSKFADSRNHCFDCVREMLARGLEPDDITCSALFDACVEGGTCNLAEDLSRALMERHRPLDTVMCTLLIKGLVRSGSLPQALSIYEAMKGKALAPPDVVTYSVLIKALVEKRSLDRALSIAEDMRLCGHRPDDIILTHLIDGCRYVGNANLGWEIFKKIVASGVKPSEYTLTSLLKMHGRCNEVDEAFGILERWHVDFGWKPTVLHYTCVMCGCLRSGNEEKAWQTFQLMVDRGVLPDDTALSTVLPSVIAARQWDRVIVVARQASRAGSTSLIVAETLQTALTEISSSGEAAQACELGSAAIGFNLKKPLRRDRFAQMHAGGERRQPMHIKSAY